jgi:hypothetical protein
MKYIIKYPSGHVLKAEGKFKTTRLNDQVLPVVDPKDKGGDGKDIYVFDQRAIVTDADGKVVYSPRMFMKWLSSPMAKWMKSHPRWGM